MRLMHHREQRKREIYRIQTLTSWAETPFQTACFSWWADLSAPARLNALIRCDAADLRRAGAQYGQSVLCAASPPSWMLLLASGCTASDAISSSHLAIHLISGSNTVAGEQDQLWLFRFSLSRSILLQEGIKKENFAVFRGLQTPCVGFRQNQHTFVFLFII